MFNSDTVHELSRRILATLCEKTGEVTQEDRRDLLALAETDAERRMALRVLAAIMLDRARQNPAKIRAS